MIEHGKTLRKDMIIESGGTPTAADSTPTWSMYEDGNDTAIRTGSFTARSALVGYYRMSETLSTANGYEIGKWYHLYAEATINSIATKRIIASFYLQPPRIGTICEVATRTDDGDFTITAEEGSSLPSTDDAINDQYLVFLTGNNQKVARKISDYTQSTGRVQFTGSAGEADEEFPATVAVGDFCEIIGLNR